MITIIASVSKDDNRDQSKTSETVSANGDTDFQFWRNMLLNVDDSVRSITDMMIGCSVIFIQCSFSSDIRKNLLARPMLGFLCNLCDT
jgi:hypothetical protein